MKLIILKNNLKEGLAAVDKEVVENNTLPILKNILLTTENNKIKISATNLETGINKFILGKIIEEGGITIPFNTFYGIISNCDSERINLETKQNTLYIKTDNYEAKIQGINKEEFPIIPKIEDPNHYLEINTEVLKNAFLKVINAAQISDLKPEISGVFLGFNLINLKLAATDSFRLSEKTLYLNQFNNNFKKGFKIIIPLKTIQEVIRVFNSELQTKIFIDSLQILFKNENTELISRLISGEYPDYEQIIPKTTESEIIINRDNLIKAIKLVSNFSGKTNDIKLKTKEGKRVLEIYSANQYLGENNYLIPIKLNGEGVKEISFNWRYLLDGLKVFDSDNLSFKLNSENKPAVLNSPDDNSYFYILMPIKI
jgi:DNA polymerase-3 subunit beta